MCGIAGFVGAGDQSDVHRMNAALARRGPDDNGYFANGRDHIFLTHARLSILDIVGGAQPMTTTDGRYTIVFNGEIYNHAILRESLESSGHRFVSHHSDTEVLLMAYREYGRDMLLKLNGMFAFVIYDSIAGTLFFARDRFGEKPFYYFHQNGCFAFASELTALRQHHVSPQQQNQTALIKLMGYGFIPSPHTIIQGCFKLPAGHFGVYDIRSNRLNISPYWQYQIEPEDIELNTRNMADKADELAALLERAVSGRMVCDVPLGVLLSGGLDSSTVTAFAQKNSTARIKTYSIGFHEKSFDESQYSDQVATVLGTDHHLNDFGIGELKDNASAYLKYLDEPLGDASYLPTTLVCELARKDVTVALTGDGADELFFGYDPFDAVAPAAFIDKFIPRSLVGAAASAVARLPRSDKNMSFDFKLNRFLSGFEVDEPARLACWMAPMTPSQISYFFGRSVSPQEIYSEAFELWDRSKSKNPVDRMGEYFTRLYLADNILMKSDRASMRVSLELRSPFLCYDVVDFARRLPASFKYHKGQRKLILKQVAKRLLPADIVNRRKKGFGIPLSAWMRDMDPSLLHSGLWQVNREQSEKMWQDHVLKKQDWRYALWNDLVLNNYSQMHQQET
jgi:asparagine synthase (glutamine-hydrolysing)